MDIGGSQPSLLQGFVLLIPRAGCKVTVIKIVWNWPRYKQSNQTLQREQKEILIYVEIYVKGDITIQWCKVGYLLNDAGTDGYPYGEKNVGLYLML